MLPHYAGTWLLYKRAFKFCFLIHDLSSLIIHRFTVPEGDICDARNLSLARTVAEGALGTYQIEVSLVSLGR